MLKKKKQGRQGRRADKEAIYSEQSQEGHLGVDKPLGEYRDAYMSVDKPLGEYSGSLPLDVYRGAFEK